MSALPNRAPAKAKKARTMSIGVVLEQLTAEFPDVTVSKIRFLESEGLVTPQRTASGYRRFTDEDVERLRFVLINQRDHYLPLKVIRQQLEAMDSGHMTALNKSSEVETLVSPESFRRPVEVRLTDNDVADKADVSIEHIMQLVKQGLLVPDASGFFTQDDVGIARTAAALQEFGFDEAQLRRLRVAAERQADMISQVTAPIAQAKSDIAEQRAEEVSQQISALVVSLHASLVKGALRD